MAKDPNNPNLPIYQVYPLRISYGTDFPGLPDLNELRKIKFRSSLHGGVIDLGGLMKENVNAKPYRLSTDDLREIAQICVHYLKENGLEGMVAMVSPSQIDPSSGADLRRMGQFGLDIKVWVSSVKQVHLAYSASDSNRSEDRIKRIIAKQLSKQDVIGKPLQSKFKRTVSRIGRNPGKSARLLLLPTKQPGVVEGVVEVKAQKKTQIALELQTMEVRPPASGYIMDNFVYTSLLVLMIRLICPFRFLKRESVLEWVWGIELP